MIALALAALALAPQESTPAVLRAPPGFAVDLLDASPSLRWPSAVHCLSDGALLVAEDPMDMPGPTDQPLDRIWLYRWKEDGGFTRTLFAEKLFASFGLEEIDGEVYVMNMPHLTVLRDKDGDGVAEERKELLTDLGPVAPGHPGGFNDHIISGLRYGMDGWLYVACGDKGVPLAHGTDGSQLSLRGGGVIRLRPDGSKLEVVARGLRNILDVAMDADGELFTYDNTDDGLGWWTRLTHVVPGGYYGYPWDYHDQPGRFLTPMAEYGGGSPTGGLVKREGGWPKPYEGSLFFCEWGDQTLRRFELARDGGTFKVASVEEFLEPGKVKDFHPTDVCESPDGRFLYVSDWAFGGWQAKEEAGRLWRVRRAEDDGKKPGGVTARVGKDATLAQRLASDGWRTRLLAQEEIVRMRDFAALAAALQSDERSALHALHAVSATARGLGETERPKWSSLVDAWAPPKQSSDSLKRARAAVAAAVRHATGSSGDHDWSAEELGDLERSADLPAVQDALRRLVESADEWCANAESRARVWKAAGRSPIAKHYWRTLASSSLTPAQFAHFFEDGAEQAIELLDAVEDVAQRMAETRRGALEDGPSRGPFEDLEACGILALARGENAGKDPLVRAKSLRTLGSLARICEPWDGKWWSIAPAKQSHPAHTVDWRGTELANSTLRLALSFPDDRVRQAALEAVVGTGDKRFVQDVRDRVLHEQVQSLHLSAVRALGEFGSAEDGELLGRLARKSPDLEERLLALRLGGKLAPETMMPSALVLAERDGTPARLQAAALEFLAECGPAKWEDPAGIFDLAEKRSADSWPEVRRASCKVIALMEPDRSLPRLLALNRDPEVHTAAFAALVELADPRAARAFAQGLADPDPEVRSAARRVVARSKKALQPAFEGMAQRMELEGAVVRELRGLYAGQQPILEWEIRGPFDLDAPRADLDFSQRESAASLASLAPFAPIRAVSSRADGMIDLDQLLTGKASQAAYAFAEFESARERDVELHVGSDDQVTVWLNGVRVHRFDGPRAFTAEEDSFRAKLLAGRNQVVLRIGQITGDWSFALTVPEEGRGPLFESDLPARPTAAEYAAFANEHPGDAAKGDVVIHDVNRTTCLRCHPVAGAGEHVGPDLAGLGARYSRSEIANSILAPSQRILDGYAAVSVLTKDDQLLFGQIKQDDARGIVLVDGTGTQVTIERADVAEVRPSKLSVMPEGLCNTMTPAEFADLVAWLSRK